MINAAFQLAFCMVVFTIIERLSPAASPHKWWRRALFIDICGWLVLPIAVSTGISVAVFLCDSLKVLFPVAGGHNPLAQMRTLMGGLPMSLQAALAFIFMDFSSYWIHRAYHRFQILWSFHVFHHTSEHLDWLSTLRLHPVSQMFNTALMALVLLLAGLSVQSIIISNIVIGLAAVVAHANVRWTFGTLGQLFVSPVFHQLHHAHPDISENETATNYGAVLSIWDKIFGTAAQPTVAPPAQFGVNEAIGSNLWSMLLYPLRILGRARVQRRLDD
jgi:sterol desaturase/sphingolipid hydroxylase (fatty acid hydroxylase superfamily)